MAEKEKEKKKAEGSDKAAEKAPAEASKAKGGGGMFTRTPVLMGVVMILEAAVLFAGMKFLGAGPKSAAAGVDLPTAGEGGHGGASHGGEQGGSGPADKKKAVEIPVVEFKAPNRLTGRTYLFDVEIRVVTKTEHAEAVKAMLKDREGLVRDRMRTIVAQSDPGKLSGEGEPGLETLRRQVKWQLDEILGEGMIDEVLVTKCTPFRTDM